MILLIFLVCTTHPTLIYQYDAYSNIIDGWEDETHVCSFETCGQIHFFGTSFNDEIKISRIFLNLEPHSHIKVEAEFLNIDDTYISNFMIDEELTQYESKMLFQICGDENPEYLQTISIVRLHNRRSVWIYIQTYYGGLISFRLSILKCSDLCVGCIDNYHKFCQSWKLHQYSFNQKSITNYDGWTLISVLNQNINLFNCGDCQFIIFQEINFFTKLPPHEDVLIRFFKLFTNPIIIDYLESQQTISFENQIEILLRNHHNPILQLNIKTQSNSDFGFIRDFELYYTQPELMFNNLNEGCLEQFQDKCLNCQEGWILDEFQENCHPICGDGIIHGQEQCDYGNLISKYSCHLCKYSCIDFCKICQFGICLQCQDGFIINGNFICDPLCGDGNLIPYSTEQCEISVNGVNGVQDGCLDCKFISIENCKTNHFSICLECEVGFDILESICFPHCGDKLILKQYEDCDDGNLQPYDGCFECKFQCIEDCKTCEKGQCIQICEDGYEYVNNSCLSVCGDQIVTKEEDCDDGNLQPWDGCFLCKYSCPQYCYDCYQGICLECYYQYQLLNSNQCKQQLNCGDGYLQEQEECDDGNYEALDGCKDCLIELNWICITIIKDSPSQCTFVKAPNLIINYLNITQNKQYISIQFNQGVKINTTQLLSKTINYVLENISQKNWKGSLFIIQDVGSDVNFGEYIISIEVNQLLEFRPILKIQLNQMVTNIENAVLQDGEKSITLKYPKFLDETQKDYSQKLKSLNQNIIYILTGITAVSLLLGSGDLFVEILAILQYQQYLRYINLEFPENLEIFFSVNDLITVQPLLDFIQFPQLLQYFDIYQNQEYTNGKFNVYKQNSSLIINLSSQILQLLIFLLVILFLKWIKKILYKWIFCSRYFICMSSLSQYINQNIILKFSKSFYHFCQNLLKLEKFMSFQGLQKALLLNGWDIIFKTLLYTRNIQTQNYIDILQIIIVIIILILYLKIFIHCFSSEKKLSTIYNQQRYDILNCSRQFFFLLFLVYVQNSQIIQLGLLLLTNIVSIIFKLNYRRAFNKKNHIVQMVVEISVLIFILSSFLYIQECYQYINEVNKIKLGWIQAIILSIGIIIELIVICQNLLQYLVQKCKNEPQTANSQLQPTKTINVINK